MSVVSMTMTNLQYFLWGPTEVQQRRDISMDRVLSVDAMADDVKDGLGPELYDIFCMSYGDLDYETVGKSMLMVSANGTAVKLR